MMTKILESLAYMFMDILVLTDQIFTSLGGWGLVFGALTVLTIYRLLLSPLLGGSYVKVGERMGTKISEKMSRGDSDNG